MNGKGDRYRKVNKDYGARFDSIFNRRDLVKIACECARLSSQYVDKGEKRPLKAIETAEAWLRQGASVDEVKTAALDSLSIALWERYSAYCETPAAAYYAARTIYAKDPTASASSAIDSTAFANRDETLKKCAKIAKKYGFALEMIPDYICKDYMKVRLIKEEV